MGFLEIQLLDARELSYVGKADSGRVDPYCEFKILSKQQLETLVSSPKQGKVSKDQTTGTVKSRRIKNTTNPHWNDKLELECHSVENHVLIISVYNYSAIFHPPMGEAHIDLSGLAANKATEFDVELQKTGKGKIHFTLTFVVQKTSEKLIKSGYLEKRGKFKNMWQTRFFVLNSNGLYWYSNSSLSQALGALPQLSDCKAVTEDPSSSDLREVLSLGAPRAYFAIKSPGKNYHFKAKTEDERLEWLLALQTVGCQTGMLRSQSPVEPIMAQEEVASGPPEPPPFPGEEPQAEPTPLTESGERKSFMESDSTKSKSNRPTSKAIVDLGRKARAMTKRITNKGGSLDNRRDTEADYLSDPEQSPSTSKKKSSILKSLKSKKKEKNDSFTSYSVSQPVSPTRSPSMTPINQSRETVPAIIRCESESSIKKSNSFLVTIEADKPSVVDTVEVTSDAVPLNPLVVYMPMPETVRTFQAPDIIKEMKRKITEEKVQSGELINSGHSSIEKLDSATSNSGEKVNSVEKSGESSTSEPLKVDTTELVDFPKQFVIDFAELQNEKKLGQGSFGVVYQMKWRKQKCAVKQIIDLELNEDRFKEFHKEALLMMNLKHHPNVVTFYGVCTKPVCIVTEYLARGSLDVILRSNEEVNIARILSIAKDIACGMLHLHLENIVHRDLAARNVLVTGDWTCKVSDFGLSRIANKPENTTATKTGPLLWMAPESLSKSMYSAKTDVYSFAITLIEILTRKSPYPNVDAIQVAIGVVTTDLRPEIPSHCPTALSNLIKECWDKDPEKRPDFEAIYERIEKMEEELVNV